MWNASLACIKSGSLFPKLAKLSSNWGGFGNLIKMLQDNAKLLLLLKASIPAKSFPIQAQNRLGSQQQPWKFWKPEFQKLKQHLRTFKQCFWNHEEGVSCQDRSGTRAFRRWSLAHRDHSTQDSVMLSCPLPVKSTQHSPGNPGDMATADGVCRSLLAFCFPLPMCMCRTGSSKARISLNSISLQNLLSSGQFSQT